MGCVPEDLRDFDRSQVSIPITRAESYSVEHPELRSEPVPEEDILPSVPRAGDVIDCALKLDTEWTCHGKSITQMHERNKV